MSRRAATGHSHQSQNAPRSDPSKMIRPCCLKNVQVRLAVAKDYASATERRSIAFDGDEVVATT
jgi:hypothetical protein